MARLMIYAFEAAWLPADQRARYVREVEDYAAREALSVS